MRLPPIATNVRSKPATIWVASSLIALVNRLIYTLTIACIPDLLQRVLHEPRSSNGVITAAFGVGGLVAGCSIGYISDRTQNRLVPQLVAAALYVVAGLVFFYAKHLHQIVLFRLILGAASSIADTMLFTTVADVYPANLLGFKMAVLFVFDNIGNMLGPLLGGKAYERMGVGGIAIIAMGLGVAEFFMILLFVRNSLDIRQSLVQNTAPSTATTISTSDLMVVESTIASRRPSVSDCPGAKSRGLECSSCVSILSTDSMPSDSNASHPPKSKPNTTASSSIHPHSSLQVVRLLLQLPVIGPTVSIFVGTGMQSVVETVFPLRLFDKFGYSPGAIGIAFMIVGGVLILAMPAVGFINDAVISRHGEHMRYYAISVGVLMMLASLTVTAVAGSYPVLIFGYALFAITSMLVIVPAQSAFGDYINATGSQAMAQCYSLAWIAEGMANISLPPIASGLYAIAGFLPMLMSMSAVLCTICAISVLAYPAQCHWKARRRRE
ncbi:hypothetical protein GGI21_002012 [Coemansia aciculifera]|uniref:Uncharacterized protein n=1 Tax=Coemansia aciculifera TaxID=417176 RepID=A0ACC1M3C1_9FUNG|nr:hypothetical protein IWW38_002723 [Coemansia aciculifera]KAJ2909307.1 hypothetical protein GGI21_002012 [Coemansia aciculifera]